MKRRIIIGSIIVVAVLIGGIFVSSPGYEMVTVFYVTKTQMSAGRHYMDSLDPSDIQIWIDRSKKLLGEYEPGKDPIGYYGGKKPVPDDLQSLKIRRIDITRDTVGYVWCGGLDHCEMDVQRKIDGTFKITAQYDDQHSRIIWPRP